VILTRGTKALGTSVEAREGRVTGEVVSMEAWLIWRRW
jgi:hypothetical protein